MEDVVIKFGMGTEMVAKVAYLMALEDVRAGALKTADEVLPAVAEYLRNLSSQPDTQRG